MLKKEISATDLPRNNVCVFHDCINALMSVVGALRSDTVGGAAVMDKVKLESCARATEKATHAKNPRGTKHEHMLSHVRTKKLEVWTV